MSDEPHPLEENVTGCNGEEDIVSDNADAASQGGGGNGGVRADANGESAGVAASETETLPYKNDYKQKVVKVGGVNITQYGKVRVMEQLGRTSQEQAAPKVQQLDEDGQPLSEDEQDEELPPALRFLGPGDVVDLSDVSMTHFEWFGTQGQKVTVIRDIEHLVNLQSFCLRSNFVREASALSSLTKITSLELYENRLNTIKGIECLVNLTNLDLSYNRLHEIDVDVFAPLVNLTKLYIAENKLTKIQGLETLVNLEVLDLGMNRIRQIEGLSSLAKLKELWLGKNKIEKVQGLEALTQLVRLSIQSNRMRSIDSGLETLVNLEELYLSHQGIVEFSGLDTLAKLNTLDVSNNKIASLDGLPVKSLPLLEELWMSYNSISTFEEMEKLKPLGNMLQTIYLDHNPVAKEFQYRIKLAEFIPSLTQIDATQR